MSAQYARKLLGLDARKQRSEKPVESTRRRQQIYNDPLNFATVDRDDFRAVPKSRETWNILRDALKKHFMFQELGAEDLSDVINAMARVLKGPNETVITQGEEGTDFFVVESGHCEVFVDGNRVTEYYRGGTFGELALMYSAPRAATVTTTMECVLWSLSLHSFRTVLATTASSRVIERCEFLANVPLLKPLSHEQLTRVAGALKEERYPPGEFVLRQGDLGDKFYIVKEGSVKCTHEKAGKEVDLLSLSAKDYFGEMALILDEPRHANVIALTTVKCLTLNRDDFALLLGPLQSKLGRLMRIRILKSVPLLANLTEEELDRVADAMRVKDYVDKETIISQGDIGERFFIVSEGEVVCYCTENGTRKEMMTLGHHDYFGERALLRNEPRSADVVANGSVECLVLTRSDFEKLLGPLQSIMQRESDRRDESNSFILHHRDQKLDPTEPRPETADVDEGIEFKDLRILQTLGTGTFGRVRIVQHRPTGQVYALKRLKKVQIAQGRQERNVINEKNLLVRCQHPFVLGLVQTFNHPNELYMLIELVQGGELWSYIYERTAITRTKLQGFDSRTACFYASCVIAAFAHIHGLGIAYRDLKPENLMMDSEGYLKVIDFGFAKQIPYVERGRTFMKTFTLCGTPDYLAPELILSKGHDRSVDYWALGCLVYELFTRRTPFQNQDQSETFRRILSAPRSLGFPSDFDFEAKDLCRKLLHPNPSLRLGNLSGGVSDIRDHRFFGGMDFDALVEKQIPAPHRPEISHPLDVSNFDPYDEDDEVPVYLGDQSIFDSF